jgi:hypothetical protein
MEEANKHRDQLELEHAKKIQNRNLYSYVPKIPLLNPKSAFHIPKANVFISFRGRLFP